MRYNKYIIHNSLLSNEYYIINLFVNKKYIRRPTIYLLVLIKKQQFNLEYSTNIQFQMLTRS